jgi:hypothetical protein
MDVCECRPGFSNVAPGKCVPFFPLPVLIAPPSGSYKGGYTVEVTLESQTDSKTVFCRFGHVIIAGFLKDRSTIGCVAPAGAVGGIELRVSSNRDDWNLPGIGFQYVLDRFDRMRFFVIEGFAILVILIVVCATIVALTGSDAPVHDEELEPLNQGVSRRVDCHADLSMQGFYPL